MACDISDVKTKAVSLDQDSEDNVWRRDNVSRLPNTAQYSLVPLSLPSQTAVCHQNVSCAHNSFCFGLFFN